MISMYERIARIEGTTHVVRIEDSVVYRQNGYEVIGDNLFVQTEDRLLFMDFDVFIAPTSFFDQSYCNLLNSKAIRCAECS